MGIGQFTCQPLTKGKLFTVNNLAVASLPTFFTTDAIRCKLSNRTATGGQSLRRTFCASKCENILARAERRISKGIWYPADSTIAAGLRMGFARNVAEGKSTHTPAS
jgi:hypothetical protein